MSATERPPERRDARAEKSRSRAHAQTDARHAGLEALRGLAALLVVVFHVAQVFIARPGVSAHGTGLADAARDYDIGRAGVIAFFAISGFVIVSSLQAMRAHPLRTFAIKRFARLYPAFWVSMLLACALAWWTNGRIPDAGLLAANVTMAPQVFAQPFLMGHYWTLETELAFYVLAAALFALGLLRRRGVLAALVVIAPFVLPTLKAAGVDPRTALHESWAVLPYALAVMFWGALVRSHLDDPARDARTGWRRFLDLPLAIATIIVVARPVLALVTGTDVPQWRGALIGLGLFAVFLVLPARVVRPLAWTGAYSYSVYLLHPVVVHALHHVALGTPALAAWPLEVYVLATAVVTLAIAACVFRWIETPINDAVRRRASAREREHGTRRPPASDAAPRP